MADRPLSALLGNTFVYGGTELLNKVMPFLLLPVLTRLLVPAEYGKVAMFETLFAFSMVLVGMGASGAVKIFFFRLPREEFRQFLGAVLSISMVVAVVAMLVVVLLQQRYVEWTAIPRVWILVAIAASLTELITMVRLTLWQIESKPLRYGFYRILQTAINFSLSLILVVSLEMGWEGRVVGIAGASAVFGLCSLLLISRDGYVCWRPRFDLLGEAVRFGLPLIPHGAATWARTGIDRTLLAVIGGAAAVGTYAAAFQISLVLFMVGKSFRMAWEPQIIGILTSGDGQQKRGLVTQIYVYSLAMLVIASTLAWFSSDITNLLLGPEYADAGPLLGWAVFGQALLAMKIFDVQIMFARKTRVLAWIGVFSVLIHLLLGYFFIQAWGALGAVRAGVITFAVSLFITFFYGQKVCPLPFWGHRQ